MQTMQTQDLDNFEELATIDASAVACYQVRRSISSFRSFTVVAVGADDEVLYVVESDLDLDTATMVANEFNSKKGV